MKKIYFTIIALLFFNSIAIAETGQFNTSYGQIVNLRSYGNAGSSVMPTYIQIENSLRGDSCSHQNLGNGDLTLYLIMPDEKHCLLLLPLICQIRQLK